MAKENDDFSDLGAVEVEDFSDLGAVHIEEESSEPKISKMDSAIEGGRQGITMGLSDEGSGAFGAGADAVQSLLNKLGITGKSPSQVNADLAEQGFTGDVGPTSSMDTYREFRDEDREKMRAAQEANPLSFLGGNLVGGIASTPLLPGGMLAPLKAAKDAGLATKMAVGAGNAVPMGAAMGLTMGESDLTQGDVLGATQDAAAGVLTGAGVGGSLPALGKVALPAAGAAIGAGLGSMVFPGVGTGVGAVAGAAGAKMLPETAKTAFKRGMQGVNTTGQQYYDEITGKVQNIVDDIAAPITNKVNKQQANQASRLAEIEKNLISSQDDAMRMGELEKARQMASNAQEIQTVNKETVNTAKKLQSQIFDVKKQLGKEYDEIDQAAAAAGVFPENREAIGNFVEMVQNNSTLQPNQVEGLIKKMQPFLGDKSPTAYRQLKKELNGLMSHGDPTVRKAAKDSFVNLKSSYKNEMMNNGLEGLAQRTDDTNMRWSSAIDLEDKYLSNLKPDRITGEIEPSPDTIRAISTFGEKTPVQMAENQNMSKLLNVLDPEAAPNMIGEMQSLAERAAKAKAFKPEVPTTNPEIERLKSILEQAQGQTSQANKIPGLGLSNVADETQLKNELTGLLPKKGMRTGDDNSEKRLGEVFNFLKNERGEEVANQTSSKLQELNKDVALRNLKNQPTDNVSFSLGSIVDRASGGIANVSNAAGRGVNVAQQAKNDAKDMLTTGITKLSNATPEQLKSLGQRMSFIDAEGAAYAKVLEQATSANRQGRDAILFGLMQRPDFRKYLEQIKSEDEANGDPK